MVYATTESAAAGKGMYSMRPIYDRRVAIELPTNMYGLRPIYSDRDEGSDVSSSDSNADGDLRELENRQLSILRRLADLQKKVETLCSGASPPKSSCGIHQATLAPAVQPIISADVLSSTASARDIVIACSPKQIPLSVLVLVDMLSSKLRVHRSIHVHSSVTGLVDAAALLALEALGFKRDFIGVRRQEADLLVTWVWKDVPYGCHIIASPLRQVAIEGERCVARFLWSLLDKERVPSDADFATQVDTWLDLSSAVSTSTGNSGEKGDAIRRLSARLGREPWLVGGAFSLADLVFFSALHAASAMGANKKREDGIGRWLDACAALPSIARVVRVLTNRTA